LAPLEGPTVAWYPSSTFWGEKSDVNVSSVS